MQDILAQEAAESPSEAGSNDAILVEETFWGYVIGPGTAVRNRARRGEVIAASGALFFCGIAFIPWLAGGAAALSNPDLMPFRIAITAIFFAIGGLMYLMAKKGMIPETQVDLHEKEIRVVRRNRGQESVTLRAVGFDEIADLTTARAPGSFLYGSLCLDLKDSKEALVIATGPDRLLDSLRTRVMNDIRPKSTRAKRPEGFATTPRPKAPRPSVFSGAVS